MELRSKEVKPNILLQNDGFLVNTSTRQLIVELSLTLGERVANTQGILLPSPLEALFSSFHPFAQVINDILSHFSLRFKAKLPIISRRNNVYHVVVCAKTSALVT